MKCEQVIELLPWYLNESLGPAEHDAVARHLAGCDGCREELEATRCAARLFAAHPDLHELIAWVEAGTDGAGTVGRHVALCPDCREEATLLSASRGALELDAIVPMPAASSGVPTDRSSRPVGPFAWATAAALLIALGVSVWWSLGTRSELTRLLEERATLAASAEQSAHQAAQAQANADDLERRLRQTEEQLASAGTRQAPPQTLPETAHPMVELVPEEMVVRGGGGARDEAVTIPRTARSVTVLLLAPEAQPEADYRLELRSGGGRLLWRANGLHPDPAAGGFSLLLPVDMVLGQQTRLLLFAPRSAEPAASYRLRLTR